MLCITVFMRVRKALRNKIHLHLIASFILTICMILLTDYQTSRNDKILVNKTLEKVSNSPPSDFLELCGSKVKNLPGNYIVCRLCQAIKHYSSLANISWLLIEGFHLLRLLRSQKLNKKVSMIVYCCFGWGLPLIYASLWAVGRKITANVYCWNIRDKKVIYFIEFPKAVIISANFGALVYILLIVNRKLTANYSNSVVVTKLANSFISLVPLLGIHYLLTIFIPEYDVPYWLVYTKMVLESCLSKYEKTP